MKHSIWRKHHKWFGLILCFFLLMFCISGIILNHRTAVADVNVSRKWLPESYRYHNWNNGLLRGTLACRIDGADSVLLYGASGIWRTDSLASTFADYNRGLPGGADYRNIRRMVQAPSGDLFAVGQFALYRYDSGRGWRDVGIDLHEERLSDLALKGDTLVAVGRSYLYVSQPPYHSFQKIELKAPLGYDGKVSLFRTVWMLHSGELFGFAGKILMDLVALVLIILSFTGLLYWFLPKYIKRLKKKGDDVYRQGKLLKSSLNWHNKVGRYTIILTLFVAITGWSLRPPILIPLAVTRVYPIPGTALYSTNAWNDNLRGLQYDHTLKDWLLTTSSGFYSLTTLNATPVKLQFTPPISVMGWNVFQKDSRDNWLIGSFSGLYVWTRHSQKQAAQPLKNKTITDYFSGNVPTEEHGSPFGQKPISGYSADFAGRECVVDYAQGSAFSAMPESFRHLPMSLWNLCVEIHTGRIYTFLGKVALFFISVAGLAVVWLLISGYKIRRRKSRNR